jgi:hypothetical protein
VNALALFPWDDAPAPIAEPTDADLDFRAAAYVAQPWTATPDDAADLARAIVYRAVEDLADRRARVRAYRTEALAWLRAADDEDACGIAWCAAALGLPLDALRGDIAERVAVREGEKDAHAEDLRRRRRRARGWSVARSSFAGHVLLAALVTRVMGGEWEVARG